LIDLFTEEGIVGRSYLEPYTHQNDEILGPGAAGFRRYAQGAARRTGRTL
jgi:hypothetical protein